MSILRDIMSVKHAVRQIHGVCLARGATARLAEMDTFLTTLPITVTTTVQSVVISMDHTVFHATATHAQDARMDIMYTERHALRVPIMTQIVFHATATHAQDARMDFFSSMAVQVLVRLVTAGTAD